MFKKSFYIDLTLYLLLVFLYFIPFGSFMPADMQPYFCEKGVFALNAVSFINAMQINSFMMGAYRKINYFKFMSAGGVLLLTLLPLGLNYDKLVFKIDMALIIVFLLIATLKIGIEYFKTKGEPPVPTVVAPAQKNNWLAGSNITYLVLSMIVLLCYFQNNIIWVSEDSKQFWFEKGPVNHFGGWVGLVFFLGYSGGFVFFLLNKKIYALLSLLPIFIYFCYEYIQNYAIYSQKNDFLIVFWGIVVLIFINAVDMVSDFWGIGNAQETENVAQPAK